MGGIKECYLYIFISFPGCELCRKNAGEILITLIMSHLVSYGGQIGEDAIDNTRRHLLCVASVRKFNKKSKNSILRKVDGLSAHVDRD
jgi:hypothetical protein